MAISYKKSLQDILDSEKRCGDELSKALFEK